MAASYKVYIDESGDEGFVFLPNDRGSTRWMVLSAVIVRREGDLQGVQVLKDVRRTLGRAEKQQLHFRDLKHEHRVPYCHAISQIPMRTVSILINKAKIVDPENFQIEAFRLYRYATRLLLERVSWCCRDHRREGDGDGSADLIFSNRSAMSYRDLCTYLELLKDRTEAQDIRIDWAVIDPTRVRAVNHDQLAGLQIADAVASGMFFSVNLSQFGHAEPRYMESLARSVYCNRGRAFGYGLKFWPDFATQRQTLEHLSVFERFR